MNAALGFRFDAAFFAISSPCDGRPSDALNSVRSIMPTPARLYHCFQRGNVKNSYFSEGNSTFPEEKTCFLEKTGVVRGLPRGPLLQRGSERIRQSDLRQRLSVHEDIDRFRRGDRLLLAGDPEGRADRERGRAEAEGRNR